ncbi:hypothetical protein Taro_009611 [Colocasia esculenta]|uniref:Uncharacterized protein n=1 Tax=Colocasia esculenta TaxID=4460 RepID=A0A843U660_COLES|nr:hypothetical protein [Colocasia esculenta]
MYADNAHVDSEVLQHTLNVIGHLSMTPEKRLEAELQVNKEILTTLPEEDPEGFKDNSHRMKEKVLPAIIYLSAF